MVRVSRRHPRLHTSSDRSQGAARRTSGARYHRDCTCTRVGAQMRSLGRTTGGLAGGLEAAGGAAQDQAGRPGPWLWQGRPWGAAAAEGGRHLNPREVTYEIAPPDEHRSIVSRDRHEPRSMRVTAECPSRPSPSWATPSSDDAAWTDEGERSTTFCGLTCRKGQGSG